MEHFATKDGSRLYFLHNHQQSRSAGSPSEIIIGEIPPSKHINPGQSDVSEKHTKRGRRSYASVGPKSK